MCPGRFVQRKFRYDPYGNTIGQVGALAGANTYRFSSKEIQTNSMMYYYGYRFYDQSLQRWTNRDPIADLASRLLRRMQRSETRQIVNDYLFVLNSPVNLLDPFGNAAAGCPDFQSQWPVVANCGGQVAGPIGKLITCTEGNRQCLNGCETEYGAASPLPDRELKACHAQCLADCAQKAARCLAGRKVGPKPEPPKR